MKAIIILATILAVSCTSIEQRKAAILKYFNELPSKKDHKVLSGQFIGWGEDASMKDINTIHEKTGKWVGFLGADYRCLKYDKHHWSHVPIKADIAVTNKTIIDYGVKFVFFCQHLNNPFTDSSAWDSTGNFNSLLMDGEPKRKLDLQLDTMAQGYKELEDNGIIVFLRPLHEMNGNWFWWGNKDSSAYVALWKYIHDYYTVKKNLKNIVWCYSPMIWPINYHKYYPGDDVVDVVCIDAYTATIHPWFDDVYKMLMTFNKPFGIGEYGPCSASDWEGAIPCNFEYDKLINEFRQYYPNFVFFMAWDIHMSMAHPWHSKVKELLEDEWVVNKDETEKLGK